jgi:N-acetylglucosamine-6-sulfatase
VAATAIVVALLTTCAAVLLTAAPVGSAHGATPVADQAPRPKAQDGPPNIVLITSDDQTVTDLQWMPLTRRLLGDAGVTFSDFLSPHPICCPARAQILTGQYAQNNGVRGNEADKLGGFLSLSPANTVATWLDDAGYQTAFVGKYLNGYKSGRDGRQPGWDIWNPTVRQVYSYFDYTMYNDGNPVDYPTEHNADTLSRYTLDYIDRFSHQDAPFFIWASHVAPHGACVPSQELSCWTPPLPATRHAELFPDAVSPSFEDPSFNEPDDGEQARLRQATDGKDGGGHQRDVPRTHPVPPGGRRGGRGGHRRAAADRRARQHLCRVHLRQRLPAR